MLKKILHDLYYNLIERKFVCSFKYCSEYHKLVKFRPKKKNKIVVLRRIFLDTIPNKI